MKTALTSLIFLLLIFSCGEHKKNSAQNQQLKKVMKMHDEVMAQMDDIMKYKKQLNDEIDELREQGEDNNEKIDALQKVVDELQQANDDMMNWMHGFDTNFEGQVQQEVVKYLDEQMNKITAVGEATNKALKDAKNISQKQE